MKIFQLIKKPLQNLGIYPRETLEGRPFKLKNICILSLLGYCCICSTLFLLFEAKTMSEYSESFYMSISISLMNLILLEFTPKVFRVIENFGSVIERRAKTPISAMIYIKANEKVEEWTKILELALVKLTVPGLILINCIKTFYLYFATDLGADAFSLPFPMWFPFDWRSTSGYCFALAIQFSMLSYLAQLAVCNASMIVGSCELLMSLAIDLNGQLNNLNTSIKKQEGEVSYKRQLVKFIQFHWDTKRLVHCYLDMYEYIITFALLWGIFTISSTLLVFQTQVGNSENVMGLIHPLTVMFWSFALQFIYCEFGEKVCGRFEVIDNAIPESEWYELPIEIQRMLPMIMMTTQEPVVFKGFANATLTRQTFKKVVNGGYSYYTILRQIK